MTDWLRGVRAALAPVSKLDLFAIAMVLAITLIALTAPYLSLADPVLKIATPYQQPSLHHLLGTDDIGRDMLSRITYGIRLTWLPSLVIIAIGVVVGSLIGALGAIAGGVVDSLLSRLTDLFIVIPSTMIALVAVAALGPGIWHTVAAMSVFWWPWYARIVRQELIAVSTRPHAEAARLAGTHGARLLLRYLLPAAYPPVLITATLDVANVILALSLFSFLGLGAPAPMPELGAMTARTLSDLTTHWWIPILPATAIFVLVISANLAGDGLRSLMKAA
jgi:peptide/nickel transport system permease protein